jgi:23S rRNA (adenine2030-N6)-methyltransferase
MNYRHHFHAGNFADVFKHIWLTRLILHLTRKETPFRYIETHAGPGLTDLGAEAAARTGEWRGGVALFLAARLTPACEDVVAPYRTLLTMRNPAGPLIYPGSPAIARALLREQDRMTFCELHPDDRAALRENLGRDRRAKVVERDGYAGLNAFLPPRERRGLVLIDPPFEDVREFDRLAAALARAQAKWASGVSAAWYPLKGRHGAAPAGLAPPSIAAEKRLWIELCIAPDDPASDNRLVGCGLFVINPPFGLANQCRIVMPELARVLGVGGAGSWRVARR